MASSINYNSQASTVVETLDSIERVNVVQSWTLNNTALKWIRDTNEIDGTPTTFSVPLTDSDPLQIGVLERGKGMAYTFNPHQLQPWSWRQMLAGFKPDTRKQILGDPGDGLVSISCEALPGSYDHKRHHAAKVAGKRYDDTAMVPIWDFVVRRASGVTVRFHPHQTNKKVDITSVSNPPPSNHPLAGRGNSDGPGTYRTYTRAAYPKLSTVVEDTAQTVLWHPAPQSPPSPPPSPPRSPPTSSPPKYPPPRCPVAPTVVETPAQGYAPPGLYVVRDRTQADQSGAHSSQSSNPADEWAYRGWSRWQSWDGWNSWEGSDDWGARK